MTTILNSETVNLPGGVRRTTETRRLDVVLIPWIRSRKVFFRIEGVLPNMRHRPLFDDVDVSDWCREENFQRASSVNGDLSSDNASSLTSHPDGSGALISDANGIIEGSFFIPNTANLRFRAGRREFKVRDWEALNDGSAISKAFAAYTAQGTIENRQTTVTTIMPPPPQPPVIVRRIDPIAQSFVIEKAEGAFITSVDVFMATKSTTVPLQVQIRPMENGIPTGSPVPGAHKFILPQNVNVSSSPSVSNAASMTNIVFDHPVYLDGFQEYAVVLLAETDDYTAWTAVTKEYVLGSTSLRVMKQPSMGSFFKSQNGSTWTPDQSRDMMFRLRRASFGAGSTGVAYFENAPVRRVKLANTPIQVLTVGADPTIRVYHPDHGMFTGSRVTLSGCPSIRGITDVQLNKEHVIERGDDADSYTIVVTGATSSSTGFGGDSTIFATKNFVYNTVFPNINEMILSGADIGWSASLTTGRSFAGDETPYAKSSTYRPITPNDNNNLRFPHVVASQENETAAMAGNKSMGFRADLYTVSDYISPVIDMSRLSANLVGNRIDRQAETDLNQHNLPANYVPETDEDGGTSIGKHIFNAVTLEEPAEGLKILMGVNCPSEANIRVYYKAIESGSDAPLSNTLWVEATIDQVMPTDDDRDIFREYVYTIDNLDAFNTFQIKLVFESWNTSSVPRVRDFRAIALST